MNKAERRKVLLERKKATLLAKDSLIEFAKFMHPSKEDPDDMSLTRYDAQEHHRLIAAKLEEVAAGGIKRLIISMPPRHGKSELASRLFPAWYLGNNPYDSLILGTYNEQFSWDFGRQIRENLQRKEYSQVFPKIKTKAGAASVSRVELDSGGIVMLAGRGSAVTGRGGHGLILDDPIKDRKEADSQLIRDQLWDWYNQVLKSRAMTDEAWMIIIQTRWHEDDLVGRLTDPSNDFYSESEAKQWVHLDLPALCIEGPDIDPIQREVEEPLWPSRFKFEYLDSVRSADPRGFSALYQGRPSPEGGAHFTRDMLRTYSRMQDLPKGLRYYAASDHAVSTKQERDRTCCGVVGIDKNDDVYVMPDLFWDRQPTNVVVERMITLMDRHRPTFWWAETGHITKSIKPFLRKRMLERQVFCSIIERTPSADKLTRSQPIHARMAMGKVFFPSFAPWWGDAQNELLKFPAASHDDFVDFMSWIGHGLDLQTPRRVQGRKPDTTEVKVGTIAWVKAESVRQAREKSMSRAVEGW